MLVRSHVREPAGYSLVEVVIALVLLAVGMLAVARMFAGSIRLSARASVLTDVGLTAQSVVDAVRAEGCAPSAGDSSAGSLRIRWAGSSGSVRRIDVRVTSPAADSLRTDSAIGYHVCPP